MPKKLWTPTENVRDRLTHIMVQELGWSEDVVKEMDDMEMVAIALESLIPRVEILEHKTD